MLTSRKFLKTILKSLSKLAIKKHSIEFVVVTGWYGTDLVKEGIYQILSEKYSIRRNTKKIWWDFSIPLLILGYDDKKYSFFEWVSIIFKSLIALIANSSNPNKIILDINLADEDTTKYWSKIVAPKILIVNSYKEKQSLLVHQLVRKTREHKGKIFVAEKVNVPDLDRYDTFGYTIGSDRIIRTPNAEYKVNKKLPSILLEVYSPVVTVAEAFDWSEEEILDSLLKFEGTNIFVSQVKSNLISGLTDN